MRKLVSGFAISLDGYIEGPNGEYDWIIMEKDVDFAGHMQQFDAFFFGRKSYEKLRQQGSISFPGIQSYIFSNTLSSVDENAILINGNIQKIVSAIKQQPGKDIALYGGADLLSSLLNHQLVDEIILSVIPVILGKGKSMVTHLNQRVNLALTETKTFSGGSVQLKYTVRNNG